MRESLRFIQLRNRLGEVILAMLKYGQSDCLGRVGLAEDMCPNGVYLVQLMRDRRM